jgi:hypothetical protein
MRQRIGPFGNSRSRIAFCTASNCYGVKVRHKCAIVGPPNGSLSRSVKPAPSRLYVAPSQPPTVLMLVSIDQFVGQALVISFAMVVHDEFGQCTTEMSPAEWDQAVQAFLLDRTDEPLRVRIAVWRPTWGLDDAYACGLKEIPNTGAPFPVAVADEESLSAEHAVGYIREPADDLPHEGLVRVRR